MLCAIKLPASPEGTAGSIHSTSGSWVVVAVAFEKIEVILDAPVAPLCGAQEDIRNAANIMTMIDVWIVLFMEYLVFVISRIINLKIHSVISDSH
jgi:hypothetical protein